MGREVAVKLVRPDIEDSRAKDFERRFIKEAALAGRLSHPNVVTVFDYGRTSRGTCYIVMELLKGRSLRELIADEGPLDGNEAARIGAAIGRGLRHAHVHGLVHRDVKPSNVLLPMDDEGREKPVIVDFGLVREVDQATLTDVGAIMGTPHYISPEQARGLANVDARADIYALGVVMYRMLVGALPFEAENATAVALKHVRDPVPWMKERAPHITVDFELEAIVRRCLEKDPKDRFPDAAELAHALDTWRATHSRFIALGQTGGDPDATRDFNQEPRERRLWWLALAGLIAFVGAGGTLVTIMMTPWTTVSGPPPEQPVASLPVVEQIVTESEPAPDGEPSNQDAPKEVLQAQSEPVGDREPIEEPHPVAEPKPRPAQAAPPKPAPSPIPRPKPKPAAGPAKFYDGVAMTDAEAARTVTFVNEASEQQIREAGVYGRGVSVLQDNRPFGSMSELASTPYIGEKTIRAVFFASKAQVSD